MAHERLGRRTVDYAPVQYPGVRLSFRGPAPDLRHGYVACMGGAETFGSCVEAPWPALLERQTGLGCLNLGVPNAGPDLWLAPGGPLPLAQGARAVVLQLPSAVNLSNPFYTVHPRRNDRFLRAMPALARLYPEVDFTEFHFTRHLIHHLHSRAPARFEQLRAALMRAWIGRMTALLDRLAPPVIVLGLARRAPGEGADRADTFDDPAPVSRAMLDRIAPRAAATVIATIPAMVDEPGPRAPGPMEQAVATALPGPRAHQAVAQALRPILAGILDEKKGPRDAQALP
ncbi:MAG: hypothetical protein H5U16_05615 [Roseovarius sp.]|nr:hypothetical protein [Roseovarius sp.]